MHTIKQQRILTISRFPTQTTDKYFSTKISTIHHLQQFNIYYNKAKE